MLNLSLLCKFFFMRVVGLVLEHLNKVQVHVNFKQNISMLFVVAYLYVKKTKLCKSLASTKAAKQL